MIFTSFKLENFKGIGEPVEINLLRGGRSFPFILVGNNESGKTILWRVFASCHSYVRETINR